MDLVKESKRLSYLLRHGAKKENIKISSDGFVEIKDILAINPGLSRTIIKRIVDNDQKNRFFIKNDKIRANQGHSMDLDVEMEHITNHKDIPVVIHGTYMSNWLNIKANGLSKMKRNHIHFAVGLLGENGVISGMRSSCNLFITIDIEKCMKDGIKFYRSANNVILSSGINGIIQYKYFKSVVSVNGVQIF